MEKVEFKTWIGQDIKGRCFVLELSAGGKYFEDQCWPQMVEKLGGGKVVRIKGEREWEEKGEEAILPSLFGEKKILLLEDLEESLALKIKKTSSPHFLVFISSGWRGGKEWDDSTWVKVEPPRGDWEDFWEKEARRRKLSLDYQVVRSLSRWSREYDWGEEDVEQFLSQFPEGETVKMEDVELYFEKNERTLLFRFLDATGERNLERATFYLHSLLGVGFPPSLLLTHIARRFRLLWQAQETEEEVVDLWSGRKLSSFEWERKILKNKNKYNLEEIKRAFEVLYQTDRAIKTRNPDPESLLLGMLVKIMAE
ncbi:MAG TPA: hypothetical protein PK844_00710 [Candidatus Atribacteria bacterium]|nr:hypothetical protein [Candidatus Atribacteria bacterium]